MSAISDLAAARQPGQPNRPNRPGQPGQLGQPGLAGQHGLLDDEVRGFLARASLLGHDAGRLLAGQAVESLVHLPAIDDVRRMAMASAAERRARQGVFFHRAIAARSRIGQGVHDRCEAYVFADGRIDDADRARLATQLPFPARFLSILRRRVAAGEVWDLTVPAARLGVDDRHDLLNVVNVGELVIEPGGAVIVQGNLLVLGCQHLVHRAPPSDTAGWQVGVLATPHSVDPRSGPLHGQDAAPGAGGRPGSAGSRPRGVPTLIGFAPSEPSLDRMDGADGADGGPGASGASGRTGGATKTAEITIGRLSGSLTVLAAGGRGGDGGRGGGGGRGGDGGDPEPGFRSVTGPVPAGRPGQGGRGGDGGHGGRGGHGGISSNVFVTLQERSLGQLRVRTLPAGGGAGGAGGRAGPGGRVGGCAADRGDASPDENHACTRKVYELKQARPETRVETAGPFVLTV